MVLLILNAAWPEPNKFEVIQYCGRLQNWNGCRVTYAGSPSCSRSGIRRRSYPNFLDPTVEVWNRLLMRTAHDCPTILIPNDGP